MRPLKPLDSALGALLLSASLGALAHDGDGPLPGTGGFPWSFEASAVAPLGLSALLFAAGWWRLRSRSHAQRRSLRRRAGLFSAGWLVTALALVSPLHAAGEESFAAHMIEHELLMLVGAPMLVAARPLAVLLWSFPRGVRRFIGGCVTRPHVTRAWHRSTEPFTATLLQSAALWLWHAPVLFDLALDSEGWHAAQHLSFFGSALFFWTAVLRGEKQGAPRDGRGVAAACLFATSLVSGALGALMAMSPSPWYAGYARLSTAPFGLTTAEDQQLAGLLMWIPGGLVHAAFALWLLRGVLHGDKPVQRRGADAT